MSEWLRIDALCFSYGATEVFRHLTLHVSSKEHVVAIVGRSGIGKSTLISLIAGFLKPDKGEILFNGQRVDKASGSRPVVFQNHNLFPWMNVRKNVEFGLRCQGIPSQMRAARARKLLTQLHLSGTEDMLPRDLSGGMKQRVGLARALAVEPSCILMDEPFSALDRASTDELLIEISRLAAQSSSRFLLVTHSVEDAIFLSDRIFCICDNHEIKSYGLDAAAHPRGLEYRDSPLFLQDVKRLELSLRSQGPATT